MFFVAVVAASAVVTPMASPADAARSAAVFVWLGAGATGVAYLCFSRALRHIPVATAVTLALAEPLTAFVLALVVVGKRPGPSAFAGLLTLIGGLAIVIRAALRTARTQAR